MGRDINPGRQRLKHQSHAKVQVPENPLACRNMFNHAVNVPAAMGRSLGMKLSQAGVIIQTCCSS